MVMDIGFGTTSVVHHAGRCDAWCCSLGQVCDCCDAVHLCEIFWLTSAICGPTPMMTDTLTRTTVGDESRYSYCLRSPLFFFFPDPSGSSSVMWCVGLLVALNFARHRQVDGRALASGGWKGVCASLLWNDGVAGSKERHVRHFMCTVFDSLWSMVVHVPYMLGFKDRAAFAFRVPRPRFGVAQWRKCGSCLLRLSDAANTRFCLRRLRAFWLWHRLRRCVMPDHRRRVSDYGKVAAESGRRLFLDVHSVVRVDDNFVRWRLAVGAVHPVFFWTGLREVGMENRSSTTQRRIAAFSRSLVLPSLAENVDGDMGLVG